jgi:hypothetical protein
MASRLFFNGQSYSTPTTVSDVQDTAEAPQSSPVGNAVVFVGSCTGGKPQTVLTFDNPDDAEAALISGDLCTAAVKAFSASTDEAISAPGTIMVVRIDEAIPAVLTLMDALDHPSIVVTSTQYGLPGTQTQIKVESGSELGSLVSVEVGNSYASEDNIANTPFVVSYTGTGASAQAAIVNGAFVLYAPTGAAVATLPFTQFPTCDLLSNAINAVVGFSSTPASTAPNTATANLDPLAAADCKTTPLSVTANIQAIVDWLNSNGDPYSTAVKAPGAQQVPANIPWTSLVGAAPVVPTVTDWTNAIDLLETIDVQWVSVLTGNPAIHAAIDAHVQYMSTIAKEERRAFVGPALGTSIAQAQVLPANINSDRTALCFPGYVDYDANGKLVTLASYMTAALSAACFAGMAPGDALTNKTMSVRGWELILRDPADTDVLIQSGVMCFESTKQGYKCVRSISTWLQNNNYNRVEVSCGAATDYVTRTVREACDPLRGTRGTPILLGQYIAAVEGALMACAVPQPQGPGVIVGDANSPAYQGIDATLNGDVVAIQYQCSPVVPNNFTDITENIVPYSGTASA